MTVLREEPFLHLNQTQSSSPSKANYSIPIPKSLIDSHSSIIGHIPIESNPKIYESKCFWVLLMSYLQVEYFNAQYTRAFSQGRPTLGHADQMEQQKSEDGLSVASSVNIRQRKVSFGIINYKNEENKKKQRKMQNLWVVVNHTDQQRTREILEQQTQINAIIKKVKLLAYEQARKMDQQKRNQKPIYSMMIHKAFQMLFPRSQKQLTDLFINQKTNKNTIIEFITQNHKLNQSTGSVFYKSVSFLFKILATITLEKILPKQAYTNITEHSRKNMILLLECFGFQEGKCFKLIDSKTEESNSEPYHNLLNPSNVQSQNARSSSQQSLPGVDFQSGFFKSFFTESGCLVSINLDKLQNIADPIKKHFLHQFSPQLSKQHTHQQPTRPQPTSLQGAVLTWRQTHFHSVTPSSFISRYNNRYFKNQRMLYKQKSKLQNRFKQQQLQDMIPQDNYEGGYQILLNSKHGSNFLEERVFSSRTDGEFAPIHNNNTSETLNIIPRPNTTNNVLDLQNSFSCKKQRSYQEVSATGECTTQLRESYRERFFLQNKNPFYVEEQEEVIQVGGQDQGEETGDNGEDSVEYTPKFHHKREEHLKGLYSRHDFEISDNQILDDIERVLI